MLYVVNLILIKHTIFSTLLPRNTTTGTTVMHNNMQSMLCSPRFGFDLIQYGSFVRKANLVVLKISRATVHASIGSCIGDKDTSSTGYLPPGTQSYQVIQNSQLHIELFNLIMQTTPIGRQPMKLTPTTYKPAKPL